MDERICNERYRTITDKFKNQEEKLLKHDDGINELKNTMASTEVKIENLVNAVEDLVQSFKGFTKGVFLFGLSVLAGFAGFFLWYVQGL